MNESTSSPGEVFDDILLLSDFLSKFHTYYHKRTFDDNENELSDGDIGVDTNSGKQQHQAALNDEQLKVSPFDISSAFEYRNDLNNVRHIQTIIKSLHDPSETELKVKLEEGLREEEKRMWERKQNRITHGRMSNDEDVNDILTSFEVWSTKKIATDILLCQPSASDMGENIVPSCSTLLNVPSGDYSAWALPACQYKASDMEMDNQDKYKGTLALPPNNLTWKEYLRISTMVSSLKTKEAIQEASESILTQSVFINAKEGFDPKNPSTIHMSNRKTEYQSRHTPADLVALWVRAQRNTSAFLHMIDLFSVNKIELREIHENTNNIGKLKESESETEEGGIKTIKVKGGKKLSIIHDLFKDTNDDTESDNASNNISESSSERFVAAYVGNHKKIKTRVEKDSQLIEQIVDWAVINQVLFTHEKMRKSIRSERNRIRESRKRRIEHQEGEANNLKRNKTNGNQNDELIKANEQQTRQMFILRWFARRNRDILDITFSSDPSQEYPPQSKSAQLLSLGVLQNIKQFLLENREGSTDRCFSRIDRRIPLNKYASEGTFEHAIFSLLAGLQDSIPIGSSLIADIDRAKMDFEFLCKKVNYENLKIDELRNSCMVSAPWVDKCSLCTNALKGKDVNRASCWKCGIDVHLECVGRESLLPIPSLEDCHHLSPLYWSPSYARNLPPIPDFTDDGIPISWEKRTLFLKRDNVDQPWGLKLYHTEHCAASLKETESFLLHGSDIRALLCDTGDHPLKVSHKGMLVFQVKEGMAAWKNDLKPGDIVITSKSKPSSQLEHESDKAFFETIQLADMDEHERLRIFQMKTTSIELTILRPSIDIVERIINFKHGLSEVLYQVRKVHDHCVSGRFYCAECHQTAHPSHLTKNKTLQEAKLCKMIIRRLGMEWCTLPFHEENIIDALEGESEIIVIDDENEERLRHSKHVSMLRIHNMMDHIISACNEKKDSLSDKLSYNSPFVAPPWARESDRGCTLIWADKLQMNPLQLCCEGIGLIVNSMAHIGNTKFEAQRAELKTRFFKLFFAYYIDGKSEAYMERSIPEVTKSIAPWLHSSCYVCKARHLSFRNENGLCDSIECSRMYHLQLLMKDQFRNSINPRVEQDFQNDFTVEMLQYDYYSSYVGRTILLLFDDPLLKSFEAKSRVQVEKMNGPIVLIVVSYVPYLFVDQNENQGIVREEPRIPNGKQNEEGLFYCVPIISSLQLAFVLSKCNMRANSSNDKSWLNLDVLALSGIIVFTPSELSKRISNSGRILASIEDSISSMSLNSEEELGDLNSDYGNILSEKTIDTKCHSLSPRQVKQKESYCHYFNNAPLISSVYGAGLFEKDHDPLSVIAFLGGESNLQINIGNMIAVKWLTILHESLFTSELVESHPSVRGIVDANEDAERGSNSCVYDSDIDDEDKNCISMQRGIKSSVHTVSRDRRFLHGLVLFENSQAVTSGLCTLCYSDLLYWSTKRRTGYWTKGRCKDMNRMRVIVSQQAVADPPRGVTRDNLETLTLLLHRLDKNYETDTDCSSDDDNEDWKPNDDKCTVSYRGIGWGFELLRWRSDRRNIRVGRITPNSPAANAGFKTNDIVVSINGSPTSTMFSNDILSKRVLNVPIQTGDSLKGRGEEYPFADTLYNLDRPVMGPVMIIVRRAKAEYLQLRKVAKNNLSRQQVEKRQAKPIYYAQHQPNQVAPEHHQAPVAIERQLHIDTQQRNAPGAQNLTSVSQHREYLLQSHLYCCGLNTMFTLVELSVWVESIQRKQPKLGMRLLCPRYDPKIVASHHKTIIFPALQRHGIKSIPQLSEEQWRYILRADWERSLEETGDVYFKENQYEYKKPVKVLPLDRLFELYLKNWKLGLGEFPHIFNNLTGEINGYFQPTHLHQQPSNVQYGHSSPTASINYDYSHQHYNGTHISDLNQRIRGGGEDDQMYNTLSIEQWKKAKQISSEEMVGMAVFFRCTIKRSGVSESDDKCIGRITSVAEDEGGINASVDIFYVLSHGMLKNKRQCTMDISKLWLLPDCDGNSDDDVIIEKFKKRKKQYESGSANVAYFDILTRRIEDNIKASTAQSESHTIVGIRGLNTVRQSQEIKNSKSFEKASSDFFCRLKKRGASSYPLGQLPDGRNVYWFSCDPSALYLRIPESLAIDTDNDVSTNLIQKEYLASISSAAAAMKMRYQNPPYSLIPCNKELYCCIWGCSQAQEGSTEENHRQILGFTSREELKRHLDKYHNYSNSLSSKLQKWQRIAEGTQIIELCADLTSHICSKKYRLSRCCQTIESQQSDENGLFVRSPFDKRITFQLDKMLNIQNSTSGVPGYKLLNENRININDRKLIQLWSRICRLFDTETSGEFRHSDSVTSYLSNPSHYLNEKEIQDIEKEEACLMETMNTSTEAEMDGHFPANCNSTKHLCRFKNGNPQESMNCKLCHFPGERVLSANHGDNRLSHGIGCSLTSDLCFRSPPQDTARGRLLEATNKILPLQGQIDEIKLLLFRVAASIPCKLYALQQSKKSKRIERLLRHSIWNNDNLDGWILFVCRCINSQMLAHAFILLVKSINSSKMPLWWKSMRSGWCNSLTIMQMPSFSSIALHIYTLDVAIAGSVITVHLSDKKNINDGFHEATPTKKEQGTDDSPNRTDDSPNQPSPRYETAFNLFLKMKQVVRWADKQCKIRYKGITEDSCLRCNEGGELVLCEFCANVVHQECIGFEGDLNEFEFVCDDCINEWYSKNNETTMNEVQKMKQVMIWAEETGASRFKGNHKDDCLKCDEGGELLLCEFCSNVVHQECIGYDGNIDEFDFVCNDCIKKWYSRWKKGFKIGKYFPQHAMRRIPYQHETIHLEDVGTKSSKFAISDNTTEVRQQMDIETNGDEEKEILNNQVESSSHIMSIDSTNEGQQMDVETSDHEHVSISDDQADSSFISPIDSTKEGQLNDIETSENDKVETPLETAKDSKVTISNEDIKEGQPMDIDTSVHEQVITIETTKERQNMDISPQEEKCMDVQMNQAEPSADINNIKSGVMKEINKDERNLHTDIIKRKGEKGQTVETESKEKEASDTQNKRGTASNIMDVEVNNEYKEEKDIVECTDHSMGNTHDDTESRDMKEVKKNQTIKIVGKIHQKGNEMFEFGKNVGDDTIANEKENKEVEGVPGEDIVMDEDDLHTQSIDIFLEKGMNENTSHGRRCRLLKKLSLPNRMKQIVAWGDDKFIPRNDHDHSDFCVHCCKGEDSRDLYLCEFCINVSHPECIGYEGNLDEVDFVCDECMIDLLKTLSST